MKKTTQMHLTSWVFGTAKTEKIIEPLLSRFLVLHIPEVTFEEFIDVAVHRLAKEKVNRDVATIIAQKVWAVLGSSDVRDAIKVSRLVTNQEDISKVIGILKA